MNNIRFDVFTRDLVTSELTRRGVVRGVAGGVLAAVIAQFGVHQAAAVCKDIGKKCTQNADCCSRRCEGKRGRKKCKVGADACPNSAGCPSPVCGEEPGGGECACKPTIEGNNACTGFIATCTGLVPC